MPHHTATAVHMAYIQLSLLHIPALVVHGNSLSAETWSAWMTPAHVLGLWDIQLRRQEEATVTVSAVDALTGGPTMPQESLQSIGDAGGSPAWRASPGTRAHRRPERASRRLAHSLCCCETGGPDALLCQPESCAHWARHARPPAAIVNPDVVRPRRSARLSPDDGRLRSVCVCPERVRHLWSAGHQGGPRHC